MGGGNQFCDFEAVPVGHSYVGEDREITLGKTPQSLCAGNAPGRVLYPIKKSCRKVQLLRSANRSICMLAPNT